MDRRRFVAAIGGALASAPFASLAQTAKMHRVAWLSFGRSMGGGRAIEAFRAGMRELGYREDRTLQIIERVSEESGDLLDRYAAELAALNPDVIVTLSTAVRAAMKASPRTPIVFAFSGDPVVAKLVESYDRPGASLTGMSFLSVELVGKRLELLKELRPQMKRVAIIANPQHPGRLAELEASQSAARALGMAFDYFEMRTVPELETVLAGIAKAKCDAIDVFPDARTMSHSERIASFSATSRIPAVSGWAHFAEHGNVLSYGPEFSASFRRLATYVDRILKGARPGDLPVELPTRFELCVNRKTANAIGLAVPRSILLRADRVIE